MILHVRDLAKYLSFPNVFPEGRDRDKYRESRGWVAEKTGSPLKDCGDDRRGVVFGDDRRGVDRGDDKSGHITFIFVETKKLILQR